jgi:hypothetical protein
VGAQNLSQRGGMLNAMESTAIRFATTARALTNATRALGLFAPGFRSPPRTAGVDRTLAGSGDRAVVSVRLRGRPWAAVAADMVEGVVVANGVTGAAASRLRARLWLALEDSALATAPVARAAQVVALQPGRRNAA